MRRLSLVLVLAITFVPVATAQAAECATRDLPRLWAIDDRGIMDRYGGGTETRCEGEAPTRQPPSDAWRFLQEPTTSEVVGADGGHGGVLKVTADGGVHTFATPFHGSAAGAALAAPAVDVAFAGSNQGYWIATADGGVLSYGEARFLGSVAGARLRAPLVSMASTPSGGGYWLAGGDGKLFRFGDAPAFSGASGIPLVAPIVAVEATPTGKGVWLTGADGGVFTYGDARFAGSTGHLRLAAPIVDMESTASGNGYWLIAEDGGIFAFGDADYVGAPTEDAAGGRWASLVRTS